HQIERQERRTHGTTEGAGVMPQILEINYVATVGWALPIRNAIEDNPVLVQRDDTWRNGPLSDLAFAIETRLMYLPQIITFVSDHIYELLQELQPSLLCSLSYRRRRFVSRTGSQPRACSWESLPS